MLLAFFLSLVLVGQPGVGEVIAAPSPSPPAAGTMAGPTQDIGWPRQVKNSSGTLIYYQPQVDEWKDYKELTARIAFSLTPTGGKQVLGVASVRCGTLVDKDSRTVFFRDVTFPSVRFPSLDDASEQSTQQLFQQLMPAGGDPISLDRLLADLEQDKIQASAVPVNNDPPPIFYSAGPAILLVVQGEPVLAPIEKTHLQFIVNTNWDLFFDKSGRTTICSLTRPGSRRKTSKGLGSKR